MTVLSPGSDPEPLTVMVIVASTRPGRLGPQIAEWLQWTVAQRVSELLGSGAAIRIVETDLAALALPFLDEPEEPASGVYRHDHTRQWAAMVAAADAFVVCTPEYNHGMPATLKNAFDLLAAEWSHKPIAFVGYGNTSAGTRSVLMSRTVAVNLGMVPIAPMVALPLRAVLNDGRVQPAPQYAEAAVAMFDELIRYADLLAPLRRPGRRPLAPEFGALTLAPATAADAGELLTLQQACWVAEALANDSLDIPALHEDLATVVDGIRTHTTWVVRDGARIIGSVRGRANGGAWEVGRLMVAPDHRGRGLGRHLLQLVEQDAPEGTETLELFTGAASAANQRLYSWAGYRLDPRPAGPGVVRMSKRVGPRELIAG